MIRPLAALFPRLTYRKQARSRTTSGKPALRLPHTLMRLGALAVFVALVATAFYSPSSASSFRRLLRREQPKSSSAPVAEKTKARPAKDNPKTTTAIAPFGDDQALFAAAANPSAVFALLPQAGGSPSVEIFAANCTTPKTTFNLGETVCVRVTGIDPNLKAHVDWVGDTGRVQASPRATFGSSTTETFTIPNNGQVGKWRANITSISDGAARYTAPFTVVDPNNVKFDVSVTKLVVRPVATAGSNASFQLNVANAGPNAASSVQLSDVVPESTTFVSLTQEDGPNFTCTSPSVGDEGTSTCTLASLASGEKATFTVTYKVDSSTSQGTLITASASISSTPTQAERFLLNNSSSDTVEVQHEPCVVTCPSDMLNVPNDPGQFGATVTFGAATGSSAACDPITYSPASGSFFPVGETVVTATSTTGSACSFIVEVKDTQAPTIACPSDITTFENPAGSGSANVSYNVTATDNDPHVTVSCTIPSGSSFLVGQTPVTCTATDFSGNEASCSFTVTVQGETPSSCVLSCPSNMPGPEDDPIVADSSCGAVVNYTTPTAEDCTVERIAGPASGAVFPIGTTTVTHKATDANNRSTTCTFTVTVVDKTGPPLSSCPANLEVTAAAGACEATLPPSALTPPTVSADSCSNPVSAVTGERDDNLPLNAPYPVGTTNITWEARDNVGNASTCTQVITVKETTPPNVDLAPVPDGVADASCSAVIPDVVATATISDNCTAPNDLVIVQTPAAGTAVGIGPHNISVEVTDFSGNKTTKTATFNVVDTTPPSITAPANVTFNTGPNAASCGVTVTDAQLGSPTTQDNCAVTVTRTPSGNTFEKGTTTIVWKVTDAGGNEQTANQTVTVIDDTPPAISCPTNITANLPMNSPAISMVVNYTAPTGSDNCAGATTTQTAGLPSGSLFPVGTTTNTFTVTDAEGNSTSCSFTVTVLYNFTGFFSPVGNLPVLNTVNAGRAIPVKFSLSGNKGMNIFATGYPASGVIACNSNDPAVEVTETSSAGNSSLEYDAGSGQYKYVWKTESSWAGTCRQLVIQLNDGSFHRANFKFK